MSQAPVIVREHNREVERYLNARRAPSWARTNCILPRSRGGSAPLSLAQEELWRRERCVRGIPPLYNECITIHMQGPLNPGVLEASFAEIIRRHEAWRTTFEVRNGRPVQVIRPASSIAIPVLDLRDLPEAEREPEAVRRVSEDVRRPFDLERGSLLRPTLVRLGDRDYKLYVITHQIIIDGMSAYQIFPSELAAIYKAFLDGRPSPLAELPIQSADFACWQRRWLQGEEQAKQVGYWRRQLSGRPAVLNWPPCPRAGERTFRGAVMPFTLPVGLSQALKELSRQQGGTLFMTLLCAFARLLHIYTGQEDIMIGTLSPAGRKQTEVQPLLGYFLNPVALRIRFEDQPAFGALLHRVRAVLSEAIAYDDVPFEALARELELQPDPTRSPLLRVALSLQPTTPDLGLNWRVTSMDVDSGGGSWDLYTAFIDGPQGLMGRAQYNPDLCEPPAIATMLEELRTVLESIVRDPNGLTPHLRRTCAGGW